LPPELYKYNLQQVGVDIPAAELTRRAHKAFDEIQREMQTVAGKIAKERGWPSGDYREVIKQLKKTQIPDDQVLDFYVHPLRPSQSAMRAHCRETRTEW